MLVKCKICGNKIEKKEAYKVVQDNKNFYYCNETEYQSYKEEQNKLTLIYETIYIIFNYKCTNSALYKEINDLIQIYQKDKVLSYLIDNKEFLSSKLEKSFTSEYAKIRYFAAILKNNIASYSTKLPEVKIEVKYDIPNNKYKNQKRKKPLFEYEQEIGD